MVVAEMPDVGGCVDVGRPAAQAVLRVGRVLERRARLRGVVDAERDAAGTSDGQVADLRVVRVHHQRGRLRKLCRRLPASARRSARARRSGRAGRGTGCRGRRRAGGSAGRLRERALVDLEQSELGVAGLDQGGGDAGDEIRAGAVVGEPNALAEDRRDERGGRRLAVRGRDRAPSRAAAARRASRARSRVDRGEDLAGEGRAAATAGQAREPPGRPGEGELQRETHREASLVGQQHELVCTLSNMLWTALRRSLQIGQDALSCLPPCRANVLPGDHQHRSGRAGRLPGGNQAAATRTRRSSSSCARARNGSGGRRR